jgi:hypothetical protein
MRSFSEILEIAGLVFVQVSRLQDRKKPDVIDDLKSHVAGQCQASLLSQARLARPSRRDPATGQAMRRASHSAETYRAFLTKMHELDDVLELMYFGRRSPISQESDKVWGKNKPELLSCSIKFRLACTPWPICPMSLPLTSEHANNTAADFTLAEAVG